MVAIVTELVAVPQPQDDVECLVVLRPQRLRFPGLPERGVKGFGTESSTEQYPPLRDLIEGREVASDLPGLSARKRRHPRAQCYLVSSCGNPRHCYPRIESGLGLFGPVGVHEVVPHEHPVPASFLGSHRVLDHGCRITI